MALADIVRTLSRRLRTTLGAHPVASSPASVPVTPQEAHDTLRTALAELEASAATPLLDPAQHAANEATLREATARFEERMNAVRDREEPRP